MPKIVDHDARRGQIVDAMIRVAARTGLHTVTMRSVAAEAGVSVALIQYYFGDKAELVHAGLAHLERRSVERWQARLADLGEPVPTRAYVEAFCAEALPTDAGSRTFHLVWTSYATLAMTDPELAAQPFADGPRRREHELADALRRARADGELSRDVDPGTEAARLLALSHGLGTGVLVGQRTPAEAEAVIAYHLDRLFHPGDG